MSLNTVTPDRRICATCTSWLGGKRIFEGGRVKYESTINGTCTHPIAGRTYSETKPHFTCGKWSRNY